MRLLCLVFPRLGVQVARLKDPSLSGRPVVLLAGEGEGALVTVASVEATAAGVEAGMTASHARERCPAVAVVRDNAGECLDGLEAIASILRTRATTDVAIVSRDAVAVSLSGLDDRFDGEAAAAAGLARLARSWSGFDVRAGVAGSLDGAMAIARTARRFPAVCREEGAATGGLPLYPGTIAARASLAGVASAAEAGAKLDALLAKLETAIEVHGLSFREVTIEVMRPSVDRAYRLTSETPLHRAAEARALILSRLGPAVVAGASGLAVAARRIGPSVRVEPWRPAAKVRALADAAAPVQRHLQLAS